MRLNFPMRSTIQAVCCGTKRMMVLAGSDDFWKYAGGMLGPPNVPIMPLFGAPFRELCWKLRTLVLAGAECASSSLVMLLGDVEMSPEAGIRLLCIKPRLSAGVRAIFCADASAMMTGV